MYQENKKNEFFSIPFLGRCDRKGVEKVSNQATLEWIKISCTF